MEFLLRLRNFGRVLPSIRSKRVLRMGSECLRGKGVLIRQLKGKQGQQNWLTDRSFLDVSLLLLAAVLQPGCGKAISSSQFLKIGGVQMALEGSLAESRDKIIQFVKKAKSQGVAWRSFPDASGGVALSSAAYWKGTISDVSSDRTKHDCQTNQGAAK